MKVLKSITVIATLLLFTAGSLFAQVQQQQPPQQPDLPTSADVSDDEINQIVDAIELMDPIQMEAQEKIEEAVQAEDITAERFQQLMMAMQNPQMADEVDMTDEEMQKIQTLQPKLMEIQGEAQQEMMAKIEESGLTVERFQQINMGAQQDPELMQRLEEALDIDDTM